MNVVNPSDIESLLEASSQSSPTQSVYKELCSASIQTALCFLLDFMPQMVMLYQLGQLDDETLIGSYGLGIIWVICIGYGPLNGLSCGLETLVSQAFGAQDYVLCTILFYKSIFICTIMMAPIFILMFFTSDILSLINSDSDLLEQIKWMGVLMMPSIYMNGIFVNTKTFLNGQNIYNLQLIAQAISSFSSIGLTYLFLIYLDLGIFGTIYTHTCLEILNISALFILIWYTGCQSEMIIKPKLEHLKNLGQFLKECIPIGCILWLEWLCYDAYLFQAFQLSETLLSTHVIMMNITGMIYQVTYGMSIASTTFIGNDMGAQNVQSAKKYAKATLIIATIFLIISQVPFYFLKGSFAEFYTIVPQIQQNLKDYIPLVIAMVVLDGYQAILTGIVRAIGRENFACISFIVCYLIIGQISAYIFCFRLELGLPGIWYGIMLGAVLYDLLNLCSMFQKKWADLAKEIDDKIQSF